MEYNSGAAPIAPSTTIHVFGDAGEPPGGWDLPLPDLISGINRGDIPMRYYGLIRYDLGYPFIWQGETRYCFEYVPSQRRERGGSQFMTCKNQAYTYTQ
jgi:hypothetical protein